MRAQVFFSVSLFHAIFAWLANAAVLVDFQVAQPPPVPKNAKQCTVHVLQRDFAFSFGNAEVVQLEPPTDCGPEGSWAAITLNFTVTSNGTQFDRLGIFTFQNVEIWRTSTPEPTFDGIIWTYVKDVTRYTPLFAKPGTFILQLDNLIEAGLNGVYSNLLVPISSLLNNTGNDVSVPPMFSLNVTLPRNSVKVFAEVYASGNGNEEFWYFNTANEFLPELPGFIGQGPFREVRLLVDGQVAGTAYPYATIFTGGIAPTAWRPITSYGALDLPTYFLDITPFVPVLADGHPHNISLDVTSAENDHTINQNWFLSAVLQVFVDKSSKPTTGEINTYSVQPFSVTNTVGSVGSNGDVNITVSASRKILIESTIISGSGEVNHVVWSQQLQYKNVQNILDNTLIQNVLQTSSGTVLSTHNGVPVVVDDFSYPLGINITEFDPSGDSFEATFDHSYNRDLLPLPIVVRSQIAERQTADAFFLISPNGNTGNGTNSNVFSYVDQGGNTFSRTVDAVLNNITFDKQSGSLTPTSSPHQFPLPPFSGFAGAVRLPNNRRAPAA
ncbi:peptide N-acetyl-beta-D-glucosaminyl asparaginase amidase A-domain-containing protein [Gymnopilus junonius]|uniref:Peptide N-acetyl-beta-D-glucosaminyl asparaginase amidase A-domain-containing protein n=1 Tax=Gymnopilus junonius TaxID=109634 RepID=A0A9P5TNV2_GYMJU|nr:peptide N-acetyl-beta-D-glucosaminyl asparaginase amidase A-domain-containing protein [Gymnopilus junonius]